MTETLMLAVLALAGAAFLVLSGVVKFAKDDNASKSITRPRTEPGEPAKRKAGFGRR